MGIHAITGNQVTDGTSFGLPKMRDNAVNSKNFHQNRFYRDHMPNPQKKYLQVQPVFAKDKDGKKMTSQKGEPIVLKVKRIQHYC